MSDYLYTSLQSPKTPLDALINLKIAFDGNLVLRPEFYNKERLGFCLGGSQVKDFIPINRSGLEQSSISHFPRFGPPIVITKESGSSRLMQRMRITVLRMLEEGQIKCSKISLAWIKQDEVSLLFEKVVKALGPDWTVDIKRSYHREVFRPSTHQYGNRSIRYEIMTRKTKGDATLDFGYNGVLTKAEFIIVT